MDFEIRSYLDSSRLSVEKGVFHLSEVGRFTDAEAAYLRLRESEGRVYSDEDLKALPEVGKQHPLYREWTIRASSLDRLMAHLVRKTRGLRILDVGCGNGWMSARLAARVEGEVLGLDMNRRELEQAARVFADYPNLAFAYGDLFEEIFPERSFDVVTMAGSVQYFPDLPALMKQLLRFLKNGGELHIMDSPFYSPGEDVKARQRTIDYFTSAGFPEMADNYFHPLLELLNPFSPLCLYNPKSLKNRIGRRLFKPSLSPFPWLMLVKP